MEAAKEHNKGETSTIDTTQEKQALEKQAVGNVEKVSSAGSGKRRIDWVAVFTAVLVLVAILQSCLLKNQEHDMRLEQRAWIDFNVAPSAAPAENKGIAELIHFTNTGKTAAKHIHIDAVLTKLQSNTPPTFDYNITHPNVTAGILLVNHDIPMSVQLLRDDPVARESEEVSLTMDDVADLTSGRAYLALYGKVTFRDVFGSEHWLHFCNFIAFAKNHSYNAKGCTDYNDSDE